MDHRPHIVVCRGRGDAASSAGRLPRQAELSASSGADGGGALRRLVERELPALVLLDVGLPGEDGFALARWLREKSGRIGIIMVTAAADTVDRVVGLETGADDYIGKPYEPRELLARIKSVLRRSPARRRRRDRASAWAAACSTSKSACWSIRGRQQGAAEEPLTRAKSTCSSCSPKNPNRPLQRDWLLESSRASRDGGVRPRHRSARSHRLRARSRIDPAHPDAIRTVRGVGYMFVPPKD